MKISKETYRNKVRGCWMGKNIGGTLGAPFEAVRVSADIDFYTENLSKGVLPNDDLDLQLAFLNAAERFGKAVDAKILAEYWVTAITPNWAEYGVGKTNLRLGLQPPVSGGFVNHYKDSNGAWIRSELWACLMPGHPELAVRYAYQDAIVDHADEGVYAEVFTAALESAAFAESDPDRLMEAALSYIPQDCGVAQAVKLVVQCKKEGLNWKEARHRLLMEIPDSFGQQLHSPNPENFPDATWGYDAPANIGIVILGWLYGEGDFGKSICIAAGCGEDGDCTTATLGAVLGIILGADAIPPKWVEPIGEEIKTCSLNIRTSAVEIPETITELTDRVCRLMPSFIPEYFDMFQNGEEVELFSGEQLYDHPFRRWMIKPFEFKDEYPKSYATFTGENTLLKMEVTAASGIKIREGEVCELDLHAENIMGFVGNQLWLQLRWLLPEGWSIDTGTQTAMFLGQYHCDIGHAYSKAKITVGPVKEPVTTIVLEISPHDRPNKLYIPIQLVCAV